MSYDADGKPSPEVAQSIETADNINYRIVLKPGWKFTDGSPVTAHSFVDAWNYGALSTNAQLQQDFFSPIDGFDAVAGPPGDGKPTTMSGLRVINDLEFTVRLKAPTVDFTLRLGHGAFYPLPDKAFRDMAAFGRNPVGNGPYLLADGPDGPAWEHNVKIDLKPNPDYHGNRKPHNKGLRFEFYANLDTAYADLLSGNLDVLDTIPSSSLTIYRRDLGGNAASGPVAVSQSLDTPLRLPHFGGEEGRLRRLALSAAINRPQICQQIFNGTRSPARDFTARSLPGFDPNIPGNDALDFNPERARNSGRRPTRSRPGAGVCHRLQRRQRPSGVGRRGGQQHQERAGHRRRRRAAAHLRRIPHPDHRPHDRHRVPRRLDRRLPVDDRVPRPALRHRGGIQRRRLLEPEFDAALATAEAAPACPRPTSQVNVAQRILLRDMPAVPLWYYITCWVVVGQVATSRSPGTGCPTTRTSGRADMGWYVARGSRHGPGFPRRHAADLHDGFPAARDPLAAIAGDRPVSPALAAQLRAQYHLDDPSCCST